MAIRLCLFVTLITRTSYYHGHIMVLVIDRSLSPLSARNCFLVLEDGGFLGCPDALPRGQSLLDEVFDLLVFHIVCTE